MTSSLYMISIQKTYKDYNGFTGVDGFTFIANLVFLRAKLDRTSQGITDFATAGTVGKIYLNY